MKTKNQSIHFSLGRTKSAVHTASRVLLLLTFILLASCSATPKKPEINITVENAFTNLVDEGSREIVRNAMENAEPMAIH